MSVIQKETDKEKQIIVYLLASLIIFCYMNLSVQTYLIQSKSQLYPRNDKKNNFTSTLLVLIRSIYK
jgi:hypothetical protein